MLDSDDENNNNYTPNPNSSSTRFKLPRRNNNPKSYTITHNDYLNHSDNSDNSEDDEQDANEYFNNDVVDNDVIMTHHDLHYDNTNTNNKKKRKLISLGSGSGPSAPGFEFAPRKAALKGHCSVQVQGQTSGVRENGEWTEYETGGLLDAWGDRFNLIGGKSLGMKEWVEVAKKVGRDDVECKNRLDVLKKKYKKESRRVKNGGSSKWGLFKKMDKLMKIWETVAKKEPGLACGMDCGEYVFMNPELYLNCSTGLDEMRDSPGNSETEKGDDDEDDDEGGLSPVDEEEEEEDGGDGSSFKLLADSINKFGEIYEKIENDKRQQMVELEKMRNEFMTEMEVKKKEMMERAQADIAELRQGGDDEGEDVDVSDDSAAENLSE